MNGIYRARWIFAAVIFVMWLVLNTRAHPGFIQSTEDNPNWRVKTTTGLSSMILKRIYSEFKIDYWLDNEPQPARKGKDTRISLGVSYKW